MTDKLARISNIVLYVLMAISVAIGLMFYIKAGQISTELDFTTQGELFGFVLEYFMYWTYALLILAAILALIFGFAKIFVSTKSLLSALAIIGAFGLIILISYFISSAEVTETLNLPGYIGFDNTISRITFAATSLYTMYALAIGTVLAVAVTEVIKIFK